MKINVSIWQEDDVWCGSVPALPGCHTWGETREQLTAMLTEAVEGWLEVANETATQQDEKQIIELSL